MKGGGGRNLTKRGREGEGQGEGGTVTRGKEGERSGGEGRGGGREIVS